MKINLSFLCTLLALFSVTIFSCKTTKEIPQTPAVPNQHFASQMPSESQDTEENSSSKIDAHKEIAQNHTAEEKIREEPPLAVEQNMTPEPDLALDQNQQQAIETNDGKLAETVEQEGAVALEETETLEQDSQEIAHETMVENQPTEAKKAEKPSTENSEKAKDEKVAVAEPANSIWENDLPLPYIRENSTGFIKDDELSNITPSRSVTLAKNQMLDVVYPGSGWVFLGEKKAVNILRFIERQINNDNTLFTLRGTDSGKTIVHFYKQDLLKGNYIDDFLEVIIEPVSHVGKDRKIAPDFEKFVAYDKTPLPKINSPQADITQENLPQQVLQQTELASVPPKKNPLQDQQKNETTQTKNPLQNKTAENLQTARSSTQEELPLITEQIVAVAEPLTSIPEPLISTAELLSKAKNAQKTGNIAEAVQHLDIFLQQAESKLDEAWFLRGQLYEQPSEIRNIRSALNSYETLMKMYPASLLWKDAQERVTYLKKFYFNIR
ncbi:MAG: hypothetical protein ACRC4W_01180 [Treponemataceae bacterium]